MTPCVVMEMRWRRKNEWRRNRYRNKTVRKKQGKGRNVEGNNTVWTSFHWMNYTSTKFPSGLLNTPVSDVCMRQTFAWLPRPKEDKRSTDTFQLFPSVFFNMWGRKGRRWSVLVCGMSGIKKKKKMGWGMHKSNNPIYLVNWWFFWFNQFFESVITFFIQEFWVPKDSQLLFVLHPVLHIFHKLQWSPHEPGCGLVWFVPPTRN